MHSAGGPLETHASQLFGCGNMISLGDLQFSQLLHLIRCHFRGNQVHRSFCQLFPRALIQGRGGVDRIGQQLDVAGAFLGKLPGFFRLARSLIRHEFSHIIGDQSSRKIRNFDR